MSNELCDEVTSINSIYGEETFLPSTDDSNVYVLTVPFHQTRISLRLDFPPDYPNAPPSALGTQSVGNEAVKGEGTFVLSVVRDVLAQVFTPTVPCVFDLIEESIQRLQQFDQLEKPLWHQKHQSAAGAVGKSVSPYGKDYHGDEHSHSDPQAPAQSLKQSIHAAPPWILSDELTEKKSIFLARAAPVTSVDQAKAYLTHLLATDRKAAKATHNITAWRIQDESGHGDGVQYRDCDDDGETAAGGRLLHLLELMNVWNAMVVVSRWYGGVHLGPDRFRLINQCARDVIIKGDFGYRSGKKGVGGKKKVKK